MIREAERLGGPRDVPLVRVERGQQDLPFGLRLERLQGPGRRGSVRRLVAIVAANLRRHIRHADDGGV